MSTAITIISGFVGAGKTSQMAELLGQSNGKRRAILMNDIAETVTGCEKIQSLLTSERDELIALSNGCICCTMDEQFIALIEECVRRSFDHVFVEANSTAEPSLIKSMLNRSPCMHSAHIHACMTVIDAKRFFDDLNSRDDLKSRGIVALTEDDRSVAEVLIEQIEHADVLVIRHAEKVSAEHLDTLHSALSSFNPSAQIICANEDWKTAHGPRVEQLEFIASKPFHPQRLHSFLNSDNLRKVLRAEGTVWIASRNDMRVYWSHTGRISTLESDGTWWPHSDMVHASDTEIREWFEAYGKRYQEIRLHGIDLKNSTLLKNLQDCLLTNEEMSLGPDLWKHFVDDLGTWKTDMDRSCYVIGEGAELKA